MCHVIHANAHIQLGFLHLLNLRFKGVRPSWCVSKVGQYMQVLNGYFHNQGTGEYWRPFGDTKNQRNTWAKKTHHSRRCSVFFFENIYAVYYFICPNHVFWLRTVYIYIDGVYRRKVPCFLYRRKDIYISIYIYCIFVF